MPSSSRCGAYARTIAHTSQTSLALGDSSRFNFMPSTISQIMSRSWLRTVLLVAALHQSSVTTPSSPSSQA
eukprot:16233903-Heterocapsa_arctica.AAC.1